MIEVEGLTRRYGGTLAVDRVSFACQPGEVFGLLGPNGAGKTTTLRMLATLVRPDEGTARVAGHDVRTQPDRVRASLGFLSTTTGLYPLLTAQEVLLHYARLQGVADPVARVRALMEELEILPFAGVRCDRLSTGMKQKVSFARATVHDPPVLILDEPTTGLDVLVADTVMGFVEQARERGQCVLFSTHIMSQAERLCDRIAVLHGGRILASGTLDELRARTGQHYLEHIFKHLVTA